MKSLIVYYSLTGNVKYLCEKVKDALGADLLELKVVKEYPKEGFKMYFWCGKSASFNESPTLENYDIDMSKYDEIILASPVWAGTMTPPLRTFIKENNFDNKKVSMMMCHSGGGSLKAMEKIRKTLNIESFYRTLECLDPLKMSEEDLNQKVKQFVEFE